MDDKTAVALLLALLLIVAALAAASPAAAAPPQPQGWVTLMAEDFEGEFPHSPWHIGRTGDPYLWGQRSCNPHGGAFSMWGGGGGALGAQTPCSGMYTPGYATTLSYGPLDLSGCTDLRLNFAHWTWLGAGDALGVGYSIDGGTVWHLLPIYGNAVSICDGWCEESFYQNRWGNIPLCGQSRVYLLFRFSSNAEGVSYGTFVDDVSLEAYYEGQPTTTTPTVTSTTTQTATPSRTPTATATAPRTPTATASASASPTGTSTATAVAGKRIYLPLVLH